MLTNLYISNFILIEKLELDFFDNFSAITGETGAGKSIILEAIGSLLGGRVSSSFVRPGSDGATVIGSFRIRDNIKKDLLAMGIDFDDDMIIVKRLISLDGKSKAYINDQPVTVTTLKKLSNSLVEIHGQFDQLISQASHRSALDKYAGIDGDLVELSILYKSWQSLLKELADLENRINSNVQNKEYLESLLRQLQDLDAKKGEEEELVARRSLIANQVKIVKHLDSSMNIVDDIKNQSWEISKNFDTLLEFIPEKISPAADALDRMVIELNELSSELSILTKDSQAQPQELEEIEQRLYDLRAMARRNHCLVDDLEDLTKNVEKDLSLINDGEQAIDNLKLKIDKAKRNYEKKADEIFDKRKLFAKDLEAAVNQELKELKLEKVKFFVKFTDLLESAWGEYGKQSIEFYVQTNAGLAAGPLAKIASGGERSRIMLALKVVLAKSLDVSTIIFDEIDSGVGGAVAIAIGRKLKSLSNNMQVFAITHSPQVASYAHDHLFISKSSNESNNNDKAKVDNARVMTTTNVIRLDKDESKKEIARMLSGDTISKEALAAAEKLIQNAA